MKGLLKFLDRATAHRKPAPQITPIWSSNWDGVPGDTHRYQALVGRSKDGFHPGMATAVRGSRFTRQNGMFVQWGPAVPDVQEAKQSAHSGHHLEVRGREAHLDWVARDMRPPARGR